MPDIIPGQPPIHLIHCSIKRGWTSANEFLVPLGKVLDARLCIKVAHGTIVKPGGFYRQWVMHKMDRKPSEREGEVAYEDYLE
jgi:hypothetical protein